MDLIFQRFFILLILEISHQRFQKFNSKDIESVKIEHSWSRLGLYNTEIMAFIFITAICTLFSGRKIVKIANHISKWYANFTFQTEHIKVKFNIVCFPYFIVVLKGYCKHRNVVEILSKYSQNLQHKWLPFCQFFHFANVEFPWNFNE